MPASHSDEGNGLSVVMLAVLPSSLVLEFVMVVTASLARTDSFGEGTQVAALPPRKNILTVRLPWELLGIDGGRGVSPVGHTSMHAICAF